MSSSSPDDSLESLYISLNSISSIATTTADDIFKTPNFAQQFIKSLYKALQMGDLVDICLISGIDNKRINAHKIVLSVNSSYFNLMFNTNMKEKYAKEVVIQEVDEETLQILVNYCYLGAININEDNVEKLLSAGCKFQMANVVSACSSFLIKQLHISNAIGMLIFAEQLQECQDLYLMSLNFVESNFMDIYQNSEEYLQMHVDQLLKLLQSNNLNVTAEEDVFMALIKWISFAEDNRKQYISALLPTVRLSLLPPTFIVDYVESYCTTIETQNLILNAFKQKLLPERTDIFNDNSKPRLSTVGKILSIGGIDQNKGTTNIECYDLRENKWKLLKSMPTKRLQFGCALYMDKLIIVGGRDNLKTLNSVDAVDLQTMTFMSLSSHMATCRHGLAVALLKNALYAIGGHDGWSYLNTVERLDLTTKTWSFVASMNSMRSTCSVAILDEKLYVIGGRESSICHRTVECYDPHLNKFSFKAPMNKRRGGVSAVTYKNYIYVFGGYDLPVSNPACQRTNSIERYDSITDTWTLVANLDVARDSIGVGILGNFIITVGGFNGTEYLKSVEKYNPDKNEITPLKSLNFPRAGSCIITIKNDQLSGCSEESNFFPQLVNSSSSTL